MSKKQQDFSNFIKKGNFTKALKLAEAELKKTPDDAEIVSLRGLARFHLKDLRCLEDFDQAVSLEPQNPYRYASRAYIKDILGNTTSAIEDYLKAIELDPEDLIAQNNLEILQEKAGRGGFSVQHLKKSKELLESPKPDMKFPAENLQQKINKDKAKSKLDILKETFSSKRGWLEFLSFIKRKF